MGRSPNGSGLASSTADHLAVRGPALPPCVADVATITVRRIRLRTRLGNGADTPRDAYGGSRPERGSQNCACSLLGSMGRRSPHDRPEVACRG